MYVDACTSTINSKPYTRYLLRESYRQGGKVKHRTLANLSHCSPGQIQALRLALRHKGDLADLGPAQSVTLRQGLSVGAVWLLLEHAKELGIAAALGSSREAKLALWQVLARVIDQGSRLSAVRLAQRHAACDALGLGPFNENHLYDNLDWLARQQARIEDRLFRRAYPGKPPRLYLYDVTSSYLEGEFNELAAFGYNRDRKRGKRQIVIGLLCDEWGRPLSVEVFRGNTSDLKTLAPQIDKAAGRFGARQVTFVGDRGMIKAPQIQDLHQHGFHYITAITKAEIRTLLKGGLIQIGLFDQEVAEVSGTDGVRYVLRCNPVRADQARQSRLDRLGALQERARQRNQYLSGHPRAQVAVALRHLERWRRKLKLGAWAAFEASGRQITLTVDPAARAEEEKLDGCYVIKTDLTPRQAGTQAVHDRYKDLAQVEWGFRTEKTSHLEIRPIYVRLDKRTRGHVFVVMLAYLLVQDLTRRWAHLEVTVEEGIKELSALCTTEILIHKEPRCHSIPEPRPLAADLLKAAGVRLPKAIPSSGVKVATKRKLVPRRKRH